MNVFVPFLITLGAAIVCAVTSYVFTPQLPVINRRHADMIYAGLVVGFVSVFGTLAILRHLAFNTGGFDLGVFDQAVWNSLHGRILETSIVPDTPNLLGQRFSPILLALVPLYALWSNPITLLIVQTLALGVSTLPLYWYARKALGAPLAIIVVLACLLSPALQHVNLYEFHEVALTAPLFSLVLFFLLRRSYAGFLVCVGVALLTKEEIAFTLIALGVFVFVAQSRKLLGAGLIIFGTIWAIVVLQFLIPYFRGSGFGAGYYYFGHGQAAGTNRYDYLGKDLPQIIISILTKPDLIARTVLTTEKIEYVVQLLMPFAFVPLIGFQVAWLALPTLSFSLISTFPYMYYIGSHYAAPLLPILGFATVAGLTRARLRPRLAQALGAMILVSSLLNYFFQAPGPLAQRFHPEIYSWTAHTVLGNKLLSKIPDDAIVVAQAELQAHLSQRRWLYEIPRIPDYRMADYFAADRTREGYDTHPAFWQYFLDTDYFEIISDADGFIIAKRKTPSQRFDAQFGEITLVGYTHVATDTLRGGTTLRPIVTWQARDVILHNYKMLVQVEDPAGHVWAYVDTDPLDGHLPTTRWLPGKTIGDQYTLRLPVTMPTGEYALTVQVHDAQGQMSGDPITLDTLAIAKNKNSYTASQLSIEQPYQVDMGEMRLLGLANLRTSITPGEILPVGLYWRAREKPHGDYAVSVQLVDEKNVIAFEETQRPAQGKYSTLDWAAGEVLLDWHDLTLPRSIAPGEYAVNVKLSDVGNHQVLGQARVAKVTVH